jgi:hypothetical protein
LGYDEVHVEIAVGIWNPRDVPGFLIVVSVDNLEGFSIWKTSVMLYGGALVVLR